MPSLFVLVLFVASALGFWRQDEATGSVWKSSVAQEAYCNTIPPLGPSGDRTKICCPVMQEPFVSDANLFGTAVGKLQIALPTGGADFSQTMLPDATRNTICPPFASSIIVYSTAGVGSVIGTASVRWGGTQGISLVVAINIPAGATNWCWTRWFARIGGQSIQVGNTDLPLFTDPQWIQGPVPSGCGVGSTATFEIRPTNPLSGISPSGTGAAGWALPGCGQPLYIALRLEMSTPGFTDAWLVPAVSSSPTGYVDGNGVAVPSCSSICFTKTYPIACSSNDGTSSTACGSLQVACDGNSLKLFYSGVSGFTLNNVDVYLGKAAATATTPTFSYTRGTDYTETVYKPSPAITTNGFSIAYDLNRNIGAALGTTIACGDSLQLSVTFTFAPVSGSTPKGVMNTSTRITGRWAFFDTFQRCCANTNLNACGSNNLCFPVYKFKTTFGWSRAGTEILWNRCCALDPILDVVLSLLPEGTDNSASGLVPGAVSAICTQGTAGPGTPCTMAMTFLYQVSSYRNLIGYYFYNTVTGQLTYPTFLNQLPTAFDRGLVTVWPDATMQNNPAGGGCLTPGDTIVISVPANNVVGWFIRSDGFSWGAKNGKSEAFVFPSIFSATGFNSADSKNHFGWININNLGTNTFLFGIEDLNNLGDKDFNDVVFGMKLNGVWTIPGLPAYDPCTGNLVSRCLNFVPSNFAQFIFSPSCISHITLDPGVGTTNKDTTGFYTIPTGWVIAPMDELGINTVKSYAATWRSSCIVGLNPSGPGFVGYTSTGASCTPTVTTITDPSDPFGVAPCYSLGSTGQLLLRQTTQTNIACNALTYGLYCDPTKPGGFYTVASSSSPTSLFISMVPSATLTMPVYVEIFNRLQVFVLMDTNGIVSSPSNDVSNLATTTQYLASNTGSFRAFSVGFGVTNSDGTMTVNCVMTYNQAFLVDRTICPIPAPSNNPNANLLDGLTNLLNRPPLAFGWQESTPRVVYAVTKSTFATAPSAASINAFKTAMINSGISVVFVPTTTTALSTLSGIILNNGIPRAVVSDLAAYPDFTPPNTPSSAAFAWQSVAYRALLPIVGRIDVIKGADTPSFTSDVASYNIPSFGAFPDPGYGNNKITFPIPGLSVTLPSGYQTQPLPRVITWTIPQTITATGALTTFQTTITWNVPPSLLSRPGTLLTYNFNDQTSRTFNFAVVDALRTILDPNGNPYDVIFLTSTFSPSVPASGWLDASSIATTGGNDAGTAFALNKRMNIVGLRATAFPQAYGRWTLTYQLFDGCVASVVGTIQVTFTLTNVLPTCQNIPITIPYGSDPFALDLSLYFRDTPMTCSPQYITSGTPCHSSVSSACTSCVTNTDCCTSGPTSVAGRCTLSLIPDCPDGSGSYLCTGDGCPYTMITCRPIASTCTGPFCYGFTECTGSGCPSGFQNGMFCIYSTSNVADMRICCAQTQYSQAQITITNPSGSPVATAQYLNGATWTNVPSGSRLAANRNVRFALTAGLSGTSTWRYVVRTRNGLDTAACNIVVTVPAPSAPPVINGGTGSTTINVVTTPGTIGTWSIPLLSTVPNAKIRIVVVDTARPDYTIMNPTAFGIQNPSTSPAASPAIPSTGGRNFILTEVTLAASGAGTVNFQWQPTFAFPYGRTNTIVFQAMDSNGLLSLGTVTVNLRIPNNQAPVWEGFQPTARPQFSPAFDINIQGSDPNIQDTQSLRIFFTQRDNPIGGSLVLIRTSDGVAVPVVTGTAYAFSTFATGAVTGKTNYRFQYIPSQTRGVSTRGTEIWRGYFMDPSGLQGTGTISITLTPVFTPPTTADVSVSTAQNIAVSVTVPGASVDATLRTITITGITFANPSTTKLTFGSATGPTVAVGNTFTLSSAAAAGTWAFTYLSTSPLNGNDVFTYTVADTNSLVSTPGTATIIGLSSLQTPQVRDFTVAGTQGATIPINFNWGPLTTAGNVYFDADTPQSLTTIIINSLPALGTLQTTAGTALAVGSTVNTASVRFVAPPFSVATQTFTYTARDNTLQTSPTTATVSLTLTPTRVVPTLTMTPTNARIARGATVNFVMTIIDSNTDSIRIDMSSFSTFPFRCATPADATAQVPCSTLTLTGAGITTPIVLTDPPTSPFTISTIDNTNTWGTPRTITATWAPALNYFPDGKTGSFSVTAINTWGSSTPVASGTVAVIANTAPQIVAIPTDTYTINVQEGASPIQVLFTAYDATPQQTGLLTFRLVTVPGFGIKVNTEGGATLAVGSVIGPAPSNGVDTKTVTLPGGSQIVTYSPMRVVLPPYWYGSTNFTFLATDPLGANSAIQTVTITASPVNNAPIVSDVVIVVKQNSCTFLSCTTVDPVVFTDAPIAAFEPDLTAPGDANTLTFASLPPINRGSLGWFTPFVPLTTVGPLAAPGGTPTWPIIYQPTPWTFNTDCTDDNDWKTCTAPYLTIPFTVADLAGASNTANLKIYILPVNHAPGTSDVTRNAAFQTLLSVPVVGTDPDNNLQKLVIVSVNIKPNMANPTVFNGPDGAAVTVGKEYVAGNSGSNTWTFSYTASWIAANTDSFTYYVIDSKAVVSPTRTGLIHMAQTFLPPYALGDSFTLPENDQIQINFVYGTSTTLTPGQHRYSQIDLSTGPTGQNTRIVIKSLPANGVLTRDGTRVAINDVIELGTGKTAPWVLYKPDYLWNGMVNFDFTALDINGQQSPVANMKITVTPVDQPPQITLGPSPLSVDRASSKSFTVTVSDVDSDFIDVFIPTAGLADELIGLATSDFSLYNTAGVLVKTFTSTSLMTSGLLYTVDNPVKGVQRSFQLTWSPKTTTPDKTTGSITLYANDRNSDSAERPTGVVQITPNIIPATVEIPTGSYKIIVDQNSAPVAVNLRATDLDPWHDKLLKIKLGSLPASFVSISGSPIVGAILPTSTVASGTTAPITLSFATNQWGTTSFNFTATDLLGATSLQTTVTIIVNRVNQAPTTQDVLLVVPEDSCVFGCTPTSPSAAITCGDLEDSIVQLKMQVATKGVAGTGALGSIQQVTSAAGVNGACPFTAWFQPPPLTRSTCTVGFDKVTGAGCALYTTIPFSICDLEGLCASANLNIIVTPVNHAPVTFDYFSTLRDVSFTVTGTDNENNIQKLVITGVTITEPATTTLLYNGNPVTNGMSINGDGSGWVFTYRNTGYTAVTDSFTYRLSDTDGAESNQGKTTIQPPLIIFPPQAWGSKFSVPEGKAVDVPFIYGTRVTPPNGAAIDPLANYFDFSGSSAQAQLIIKSLPADGTITDINNRQLAINDVLPSPKVIYQSTWGYNGDVSFDFVTFNPLTGTSNVATMIIEVTHVNRPPVISLTPLYVVGDSSTVVAVDRLSKGELICTASDVDSPTIDIILTKIDLPFGAAGRLYSTFTVTAMDGTIIKDFNTVPTTLTDGTVAITLSYGASPPGGDLKFKFIWTPTEAAPDGTTGVFSAFARDNELLTSGTVDGAVIVTPNRPPTVQDATPSYYTITLTEDAWTSKLITLEGTDPDRWHQTNLTFILTSLPQGVSLSQGDDTAGTRKMIFTDLPLTVSNPTAITAATRASVNIFPVLGWSGTTHFDFFVKDLLGAVSAPQRVNIEVIHVNHPPTSSDSQLIVPQNFCVLVACGAPTDISNHRHATLDATDPDLITDDPATLTLKILDFPDPVTVGTIHYFKDGVLTTLTGPTDFTRTSADTTWPFWLQPVRNIRSTCTDKADVSTCAPLASVHYQIVDKSGSVSVATYVLDLIVTPVNQPPSSRDLSFYIPQNTELVIFFENDVKAKINNLPASDPDNTDTEISAQSRGIVSGSRGTFRSSTGAVVPASGNLMLPGRYLKFTPDLNTFSLPSTSYATMVFNVYDQQPLFSDDYRIFIYVDQVCLPIRWTGPRRIVTLEETAVGINLLSPDYWDTPNAGEARVRLLTGPKNGKGYFFTCVGADCFNITSFPYEVKGNFFYVPPLDENGQHYTTFDFDLMILDSQGRECPGADISVNFVIDVTPVNDPPVLVPLWYPGSPVTNECAEDTFLKLRFTAYDIDNTCDELIPQVLTIVDPLNAALFTCNSTNRLNATGAFNCSDGVHITSVEFIHQTYNLTLVDGVNNCSSGDVVWLISVIPYPNWNGRLRLQFLIWDMIYQVTSEINAKRLSADPIREKVLDRFSQSKTAKVRVWPVNDPPSIIKGKTAVDLERYTKRFDQDTYSLVGTALSSVEIRIYDRHAADERVLEGEPLTQQELAAQQQQRNSAPEISKNLNATEYLMYRVRTEVQDIDFFFGESLRISGYLIDAKWVDPLLIPRAYRPETTGIVCEYDEVWMNCTGVIGALSHFLGSTGFPAVLNENATIAYALFTLNDLGNIDIWNRPLETNFTIVFLAPVDDILGVPVAVVVILPVVAAATAATILAAWCLLGKKAAAAVGSNFDAFTIGTTAGGTLSPLYEDGGRVVASALYVGDTIPATKGI